MLEQAERMAELGRPEAKALLAELTHKKVPGQFRAQALANLAIVEAREGSRSGVKRADAHLQAAAKLRVSARIVLARLAHARGYLAYKRGEGPLMLHELNRACSLYRESDRRRAHVFDTLGTYFVAKGDLERARSYYLLSLEAKKQDEAQDSSGLAITYGNLGRLELAREHFPEAEHWFRKDLEVLLSGAANEGVIAHVRNQLALSLIEQGRLEDAKRELEEALRLTTAGSMTNAYVLKDLARIAHLSGDRAACDAHLRAARALIEEKGYAEVGIHLRWIEGLALSVAQRDPDRRSAQLPGPGKRSEAQRTAARSEARSEAEPSVAIWSDDDAYARAISALDEAVSGFAALSMHLEVCKVALDKADLLIKSGRKDDALRLLRDEALRIAERHLFDERSPLDRIEARIAAISRETVARVHTERMLGGITPESLTGRLKQSRERITVWTCDIRGFTAFCDATEDPAQVVQMLNRFFREIGRKILDHRGVIDKYVGDNILAWFRDPIAGAGIALEALSLVELLNTERRHLAEQELGIGIGIATGEVIVGNVGFAGKLEHTIIGTPVNTACRLVGIADQGKILMDEATRLALGERFASRPFGSKQLKGLGKVRVWALEGRRVPRGARAARG
jgi:class 3 adenylate cyclase